MKTRRRRQTQRRDQQAPPGYVYMPGAKRLTGYSLTSLRNRTWRQSVGLVATRLGKRLAFRITDIEAWLESRREVHAPKPAAGASQTRSEA